MGFAARFSLLRTVVFGVAMLTLARAASATYQMLKCYKSVLARGKLCCVCVWPFLHSLSALALIDLRRAQHMAVVVMSTMEPAGSELPHPRPSVKAPLQAPCGDGAVLSPPYTHTVLPSRLQHAWKRCLLSLGAAFISQCMLVSLEHP